MTTRSNSNLVVLLIALSLPIAFYAFAFQLGVTGDPDFQVRFSSKPLFSGFHFIGAGIALLLGGFQFVSRIRNKVINVHRWFGRTYLLAVLIGGTGGFVIAFSADGGLVGRMGFATLAVIWLYSGWQAYAAVRRGDIATHRVWMMRNFALTFAAVTLRIYLGILTGPLEIPFVEAYASVAWISWVPNLLVVEWFLLQRDSQRELQPERQPELRRELPLTNTDESPRAL